MFILKKKFLRGFIIGGAEDENNVSAAHTLHLFTGEYLRGESIIGAVEAQDDLREMTHTSPRLVRKLLPYHVTQVKEKNKQFYLLTLV